MLITRTTCKDIEAIQANQYYVENKKILKESLVFQEVFTFKDDKIRAIVMFYEFYPHCFRCGIILAKDIKPQFLKKLKFWLKAQIKKHKCTRLETEGFCDKTLYRFHKFFGFTEEVIIDKGNYIKWVM